MKVSKGGRLFRIGDTVVRADLDGSIYIGLHGMGESWNAAAWDSLWIGQNDVDDICSALQQSKAYLSNRKKEKRK